MNLAEILVALAVSGLLFGGTALLLEQGQQAHAVGQARVEIQQGTRLALERLAAEIRGAGFATGPVPIPPIAVATPTRLTIQHDLDGDGVASSRGERITYLLRGTTLRRDAGGGAQPMLDGVKALSFTYLDAERRETAAADEVRSVVVSLTVAPARARWLPWVSPVVAEATIEARLRNR